MGFVHATIFPTSLVCVGIGELLFWSVMLVKPNLHRLVWLVWHLYLSRSLVNANTCWFYVCLYSSVFRATLYTPEGSRKVCLGASVLLSSNWSCMLSSCRAYFIGDSSPMQQPDLYICSINSLMQYFVGRKEPMPLVVNTCGWLRGWPPYSPLNTHTHTHTHTQLL